MATTTQARTIRILEIKIDMAVEAQRSGSKAERVAAAASVMALGKDLASAYRVARGGK